MARLDGIAPSAQDARTENDDLIAWIAMRRSARQGAKHKKLLEGQQREGVLKDDVKHSSENLS